MIQIVYGSGGGNTELVCNMLAEKLLKKNKKVHLTRAKVNTFDDLLDADLYVFASPTYGHGQLERYMDKFIGGYKKSNFSLEGKNCAVVALGDKKYDEDYYIEAAKILSDFVESNGGHLVAEPLRIGGCVYPELEEKIAAFCREI